MRKWIGRAAFSFIVIGAVLVWEGNHAYQRGERTRGMWSYTFATVCMALGILGVRARHNGGA